MKKLLLFLAFALMFQLRAQEKWTMAASQAFQKQINSEYADRKESPLTDEDFAAFKTLDFYPIDGIFAVVADFIRTPNEKVFKMKTSSSRLPEYVKYGELHFTLDGKRLKLNLYQNVELVKKKGYEDHLFLPFSDLTCGEESYIGGRYIDMKIPSGNQMLIDFNTAYNPYCAYNHKYSCPIVPLENDLAVEIRAGVKKFHD